MGTRVIALKKNQGGLYERVEKLFEQAIIEDFKGLKSIAYVDYLRTENGKTTKDAKIFY